MILDQKFLKLVKFNFLMAFFFSHTILVSNSLFTAGRVFRQEINGVEVMTQIDSSGKGWQMSMRQIEKPSILEKLSDAQAWQNGCQITKNFCQEHAGKITAGFFVVTYAWIFYQIRQAHALIANRHAWCNWQKQSSLSNLQAQPEEALLAQLKLNCVLKYSQILDAQSVCDVRYLCMQEIKKEFQTLVTYETWYARMLKIFCDKLFNFSYDLCLIQEKKDRLCFVFNLCKTSYL